MTVMAAMALLHHYLEYITTPGVLLALMIVVVPVLLSIIAEDILAAEKPSKGVSGCRRLGKYENSNLDDQYQDQPPGSPVVKALFTYPIKSCRGVELGVSEVLDTGLAYDRLFAFAQLVSKPQRAEKTDANGLTEPSSDWKHEWRFITQRDFPRLALLQTELWVPELRNFRRTEHQTDQNGHMIKPKGNATDPQRPRIHTLGSASTAQLEHGSDADEVRDWAANGGCLIVRFPFQPDFSLFGLRKENITIGLPLAPTSSRAQAKQYSYEHLTIWKDCPRAINVSNEIDPPDLAKLKYFLGISNPLGLFRVDQRNHRTVARCLPKARSQETFKYGFADSFPANILSLESVRALDSQLPAKAVMKSKLDARRFRANIYVTGSPAYAEDSWRAITVGRRIGRDEHGLFEKDADYHVAMPCVRCKLPNVDPNIGVKDNNEPDTTLRRTRKIFDDAPAKPCLGMQMIPLFERGIIRVRDNIQVLETGKHFSDSRTT